MKTPYVNLNDGTIHNCRVGTKIWWHEQGHVAFDRGQHGGQIKLWQQYAFMFWIISITLSILNHYMLWLAIPLMLYYIGTDIYEEWWANRYAARHCGDV